MATPAGIPAPEAAGTWSTAPGVAGAATAAPRRLSGFWRRFWAMFLDRFVLSALFTPFFFLLAFPVLAQHANEMSDADAAAQAVLTIWMTLLPFAIFAGLCTWLYFALFQASAKQATLGQMALGIRVTDLQGRRISFARATGRYFAHIVTGLTLGIGFLTVLFTEKKQCVHDMIAGTMVERG
jgi:uncharacterized RDD family membrane protein YckC